MDSFKWIDISRYREGEKGNIEPFMWEINIGDDFRIVIHKYVGHEEEWCLTCYRLCIDIVRLKTNDLHEAKSKAKVILLNEIEKYIKLKEELESSNL